MSVIVPAYNARATIAECLRALVAQSYPKANYEIIVVDDGSDDATSSVAKEFGVTVLRRENGGAGAARNTGWRAAAGEWIAFTDSDCMPARTWLAELMRAVSITDEPPPALGAAGKTFGYDSKSDAARYVDLCGGLDAERHLSHPLFPFAPSLNLMYRREVLEARGGFDERYKTYEGCELHERLSAGDAGKFVFAPRAVVLHRHRAGWGAYWRQQYGYGIGYGQFMIHHAASIRWTPLDEIRAWFGLVLAALRTGFAALLPGEADRRLVDRGNLVKAVAQRAAFVTTYWSAAERRRW